MSDFSLDFTSFPDPNGPIETAPIPWDTDLYGFPVHEMRVRTADFDSVQTVSDWLSSLDTTRECLVCAKVDQQSAAALYALARNGFYPLETVLDVRGALPGTATVVRPPSMPVLLREARQEDIAAMKEIAASAFWSDRYHIDPNLSNAVANERYVRWIERAFEGDDLLYAYERTDEGSIIGFYHVRPIDADTVDLTLAAVDPALTGHGLGSVLYGTMVGECARLGFTKANTRIVARNLAVMNIFARLGFSFRGAATSLHWHSSAISGADDESA